MLSLFSSSNASWLIRSSADTGSALGSAVHRKQYKKTYDRQDTEAKRGMQETGSCTQMSVFCCFAVDRICGVNDSGPVVI